MQAAPNDFAAPAKNSADRLAELQQRFLRLLGALAEPDQLVGRLDILGAEERQTILREWNATARAVPGATLPELFAAQVARTPEADAVVFEDERLSYGELDARSSRLAHHLRGLGVGPEVVVGLCIERSLAMLVGLLGILKAGGAYLPLDLKPLAQSGKRAACAFICDGLKTDWLAGHIGFEPANPSASYLIGIS